MREACQPGRQQRVVAAEKTSPRRWRGKHLRRADQRAGRHRLQGGCSRPPRESGADAPPSAPVTLQAAAKGRTPAGSWSDRSGCGGLMDAATAALAPFTAGSMKKFKGRADQNMRERPMRKAGVAPTRCFAVREAVSGPADGRGETPRSGVMPVIEAGAPRRHRCAPSVPKAASYRPKSHADAEQKPGPQPAPGSNSWQPRQRQFPAASVRLGDRQHRPGRRPDRSGGPNAWDPAPLKSPATPRRRQIPSSRKRPRFARESDRPKIAGR